MPIIRNTVPDAANGRALVNIYLCDGEGRPVSGYTSEGDTIRTKTVVRAVNGEWQVDLPSNLPISPAGTLYKVQEVYQPGNKVHRHLIRIPNGGGPYDVGDILVTELSGIDPADLNAENILYENVTSGLDADNVQDALDELAERPFGGGGGSSPTLTMLFPVPTDIFHITHNMGGFPIVTIIDSGGEVADGGVVDYLNENEVEVKFLGAFSGKAVLKN